MSIEQTIDKTITLTSLLCARAPAGRVPVEVLILKGYSIRARFLTPKEVIGSQRKSPTFLYDLSKSYQSRTIESR